MFGLVVAVWVMQILMAFKRPVGVPVALDLHLDERVLTFALLLSIGTGLFFGLAPAFHSARADIVAVLKDDTSASRRRRSRLRSAFVVAQVACSTLLLVGASLFVRSLQQARAIDLGFDPSGVIVMSLNPALQGYGETRGVGCMNSYWTASARCRASRLPALPKAFRSDWAGQRPR